MLAVVVIGILALAGLGLILFAVYKIGPILIEASAAILKILTVSVKINRPEQRSHNGKSRDGKRPDP